MYNKGNYVQYPIINHNGEVYKTGGGNIYIYIIESLCCIPETKRASLVAQTVKNLLVIQETWVQFLCQEDLLKKGIATHSSILSWRISGTEEPRGLQFMKYKESVQTEQLTLSLSEAKITL